MLKPSKPEGICDVMTIRAIGPIPLSEMVLILGSPGPNGVVTEPRRFPEESKADR